MRTRFAWWCPRPHIGVYTYLFVRRMHKLYIIADQSAAHMHAGSGLFTSHNWHLEFVGACKLGYTQDYAIKDSAIDPAYTAYNYI